MAALERDLRQHPDAFQYEHAARFGVSQRGIGQALGRLGVTYKKRSHSPKQTKTNGRASGPASRPMKRRAGPSFISMKAALPPTWRAAGQANVIGALVAAANTALPCDFLRPGPQSIKRKWTRPKAIGTKTAKQNFRSKNNAQVISPISLPLWQIC